MSRQLPLPFAHEPIFTAQGFLPAPCNEAALAWMRRTAEWPLGRLALWGPAGSGKSHLLHLWAGSEVVDGPGLRFSGPPAGPVAVDRADLAPAHDLLHLLNAAAEAGQPVLLAARAAPARWDVDLPDLSSRLRAITAVEIRAADETLLRSLLARLLAERQIPVAEEVQDWLLLRLPRTQAAIREAADRLDSAALARGGPVSRAVARDVLASMIEATAGAAPG